PCTNVCGVSRKDDGKLYQGCWGCTPEFASSERCKTCERNYCNEEKLVDITCWETMGKGYKKCFTSYNGICSTERSKTNKVLYGCGKCPSKACKECKGNLCNDGHKFPYFCLDSDGKTVKECSKSECYIDEGSNAGCFGEHNKNIPYVSCNTPLCNTKELLKKTLFCLEKDKRATIPNKIACKNVCSVSRDEDGELTQGCWNCDPNDAKKQSCKSCKTNYCNVEELVDYKCFESDGKACFTPRNANCFVARPKDNDDKYISGCGSCISKPEECFECNGNKCNDVNFAKSKLFTCLSYYGETTRYCAKNINECYYYKIGAVDSGCGKCPEESYHHYHC
ncbi:Galectin domain-containing protein, partial [Meloidogyne graminicola]